MRNEHRRLVGLLVTVVLCTQPAWAKKARLPRPEILAGHWIAYGDTGNHFRLILDAKGCGFFGVQTASGSSYVYRVDQTQFDKFKIRIHATEIDGEEQLVLKGTAPQNRWLDLRFTLWRGQQTVRFFRVSEASEIEERLRLEMEKHTE